MRRRTLPATCLSILLVAAGTGFSSPPDAGSRQPWIEAHGRAFTTSEPGSDLADLAFLDRWIGEARVVGLGEGTHGSHEFYRLKHRLFEYLAIEKGFDLFVLEANMPECERINAFVLGEAVGEQGTAEPRRLLADLNQWVWNNEAFLDLIVWMRAYNREHERKLRFAGFDMKWPRQAMDDVVQTLAGVVPELSREAAAVYAPLRSIEAMGVFPMWGIGLDAAPLTAPTDSNQVRLSGWMRTEGMTRDWAGLWLRVRGDRTVYLDTSQEPSGDGSWKRLELELEMPEGAHAISFGISDLGNGTAWFDDLVLEVDGEAVPLPGLDAGFEGNEVGGLTPRPLLFPALQVSDYEVGLDRAVFRGGRQSLRITYDPRLEAAVDAAETVLGQIDDSREVLELGIESNAVERLRRNARLVVQAMEWRARFANRDHLMAENLRWILAQEPADARIVVSAANSHIGRVPNRMGELLANELGEEYLAIALTTFGGRYAAADRANRPGDYDLPGAPPQSLEFILETAGHPQLMIDLRQAKESDETSGWLLDPGLLTRGVGSLAMERQFAPRRPATTYDLLAFIRDTTASRRLPEE